MAIAETLASIAEFIGNAVLFLKQEKSQAPFPTISMLGAGLVVLMAALMATFILHALAPTLHPFVAIFAVSVGAITLIVGTHCAGFRLGFIVTPARCFAYALFATVGSLGALFIANAL